MLAMASLKKYQRMRDFAQTAEPSGRKRVSRKGHSQPAKAGIF